MNVLFIGGSMNQTTQMAAIADALPEARSSFSPYIADGLPERLRRCGLLERTILGTAAQRRVVDYCERTGRHMDIGGHHGGYDVVVTCSDLIVPHHLRRYPMVLVQEGMTDPERLAFRIVRRFPSLLPYLPTTSATGLSDLYTMFCVASEGYRRHFVRKGVRPEKIVVTGIPNFDNAVGYLQNSVPHRGYVLLCTSDMRETWKVENRRELLLRTRSIARGRQIIVKLHPNENHERARREIARIIPDAIVYTDKSAEHLIANCSVLVTRLSSVVFIGLALGKEVHSDFPIAELRTLLPDQHGKAAVHIAQVCRQLAQGRMVTGRRIASSAMP
jgi:hypothetical protein